MDIYANNNMRLALGRLGMIKNLLVLVVQYQNVRYILSTVRYFPRDTIRESESLFLFRAVVEEADLNLSIVTSGCFSNSAQSGTINTNNGPEL